MASTADIRNGLCIEHNNDIYVVVEFQHVKPGKGAAFVRTKLKSVTTKKVLEVTFPSGHKITDVRVERRTYQFLYEDDNGFNFMDKESYDQILLDADFIPSYQLLKEGDEVTILMRSTDMKPLVCEMPQNVILKVTYTERGLKGDTATNTLKPATVETGAEVRVPLFIEEGDVIKIDTATFSYLERIKK